MCQIKLYKDEKREENLLMEDVFKYEIDYASRILSAYSLFGERKDFKLSELKKLEWSSEKGGYLVVSGIESIV